MNFRLSLAAVGAATFALPAAAQQADTDAILKAIQGLSSKVDGIQKDVDKLKGESVAGLTKQNVSGRPAPVAAAAPKATTKPDAKAVAGWLVNVVPGDDESKDPVARFDGPLSDFTMSMHSKYVSGDNEYAYQGEAFFHAKDAGRYVFVIELDPISTSYNWRFFNCTGQLSIADNPVVTAETGFQGTGQGPFDDKTHDFVRSQTFSGGTDLEANDYKMKFKVGCWLAGSPHGIQLEEFSPHWRRNSFKILVRGPDDSVARPFETDELFHKGKLKRL